MVQLGFGRPSGYVLTAGLMPEFHCARIRLERILEALPERSGIFRGGSAVLTGSFCPCRYSSVGHGHTALSV